MNGCGATFLPHKLFSHTFRQLLHGAGIGDDGSMRISQVFGRLARFYETDRRKSVRVPAVFDVTISGAVTTSRGQGVDLDRAGMKVRCDMAMEIGSKVYVRLEQH